MTRLVLCFFWRTTRMLIPHHEQPGLLPVRPDVGDALPQGRHGLRLEDVGISAYFDNRRTDLFYFFIVR